MKSTSLGRTIFRLITLLFLAGAFLFALQVIVLTVFLRKGTYDVTSYTQEDSLAKAKILFLGDSTAVGTGADCHHHSVAGYFGQDYPQASVSNISRNGLRLNELVGLWHPSANEHYDLVVIQVGGNDILKFTPYEEIQRNLPILLARAKSVADHVVILHSGDVGRSSVFIWPFNKIMTMRTLKLRDIYQQEAKAHGAIYIDLFKKLENDPQVSDIPFYYGPDRLHPSAGGYYKWYEQIQNALKEAGVKL